MDFRSVNVVILVGIVASDPELKITKESPQSPGGRKLCRFDIMTAQAWKGLEKPKPFFHKCQTWGKLAEIAASGLKKNAYVSIRGALAYYMMDIEGRKVRFDYVNVETLTFLPVWKAAAAPAAEEPEGEDDSLPEGAQDPIDKGDPFGE